MTTATPMMAYSMSKVITARAVSTLEREGLLRFDDPVARYVPALPCNPGITVRHLLEHRSGLPNPIPLRWVHPDASHAGFDEAAAVESILRQTRLRAAPGTRTIYSNLGYWLLGRLVEHVAKQPFTTYVEQQILRPWGIAPDEIGYLFPPDGSQARGYLEVFSLMNVLRPFLTEKWVSGGREGKWIRIQDHYVNGPAFGGAIGTAAGFCKFAGRLVECGDAGFGWSEGPHYVQKEGGGAGFRCMLRIDRESRRASVIMSNATGLRVSTCLDRILSSSAI
jgi:CubicO group peptidase (beta-lactamase class C family)